MSCISIITPFRNAEKYILETAESIFSQTHSNWEWILINDHSNEKEEEILKPFLNDSRLKLIANKGKGIIDALVTGLDLSSGEYITRMDADDIMPSTKLDLFLQVINSSGAEIVTGKVKYFSETNLISKGYQDYEKWLNEFVDHSNFYSQIYRECTLSSANWLMRKEKLLECGGFDGLRYPEDYDLLFRWYQHNYRIQGIDEVTHLWREHPERTSRNSAEYNQENFFKLKINRFLKLDFKDYPLVLNGTGRKGRLAAQVLIENKIDFVWVSIEPEKFKAGLYRQIISGHESISFGRPIQILNAAKIDEEIVRDLYNPKNVILSIFNL